MYFSSSGKSNSILGVCLLVIFVGMTQSKALVKSHKERTQLEVQERSKINQHKSQPTSYYFKYKGLDIDHCEYKSEKSRYECKIISSKIHDKQDLVSLWRDTFLFYDSDGLPIATTKDCEPEYQTFIENCDEDGWYQHSWWKADKARRDGLDVHSFTYYQKNIPFNGVFVELCMFQTVDVYYSELFNETVQKTQNYCSPRYVWADILKR